MTNQDGRVAMRSKTILALALLLCASFALAQQGDLYSRIDPLEKAYTSGTATHDQQIELARLYNQAGRYYDASKITDQLLAADANDNAAATIRDEAARGMRDAADKKVAEAEAAAKKDGATDQDRLALANAYFDAGSYGAAADIYGRLPSASLDLYSRLRYARSLSWSNHHDQAERAYSDLLQEESTPDLQLEYGRVLSWMGAQKASVDALSDIYNKTPTEDAAIALANAKAWSGDRDGAIALLNDFAQSHPDATRVRPLIDQLRASPDVRIERIGKIIAIQPYNTDARIKSARVLSWDSRWSESQRQYEMLLSQYPDRADLRYEYARVLSWGSQFGPAIHTFRTLTDLSSNPRARLYSDVPSRAYYNLGQIYRWYGWNDAALTQQNRPLALDPGYLPAP